MKAKRYSLIYLLLIWQAFFTATAQCDFTREELQSFHDVNHTTIKTILDRYISENADILNSSKDKDIVAFIGKTNSGKSTLINYLTGQQLVVDDVGSIALRDPNNPTAMKIGVGHQSETFLPKSIRHENLVFYDLPGIGETRGAAISLINACFIKRIIENARTVQLVFVVGQDEFSAEKGRSFKDLYAITRNLIPNNSIESTSAIIVTKSTPGYSIERLTNLLRRCIEPGVLDPWINAQRLTHMSAPLGDEINQTDRTSILQIINAMPSRKIDAVNIGVIYNHQEQDRLKEIYAQEIEDNFNRIQSNNIDTYQIPTLDIPILERKIDYFQNNFFSDLNTALQHSALLTLLRPISEPLYIACWNAVKENKQIKNQNLLGQLNHSKTNQLRINAEKNFEDEKASKKAEEQRRINAENAQRAAEEARKVEEQRRIEAENDRQAVEAAKRAEEQRRIKAEKDLEDAKVNDPSNWPTGNAEVSHLVDKIVVLKSVSSNGYLDGRRQGGDNVFVTHRIPIGDDCLQWIIQLVDGNYALKSVSSNGYLDGRLQGGDDVLVTHKNPIGNNFLQWLIAPQ